MISRLVLVVVVGALVVLAFWVGKRIALHRSRRAVADHGWSDADFSGSAVTVVMFKGPSCTQCDAQKSIIAAVQRNRPDVGYVEMDAGTDSELARRLRVLTVPTTVIVDSAGNIIHRNGKLIDEAALARQIDSARGTAARAV